MRRIQRHPGRKRKKEGEGRRKRGYVAISQEASKQRTVETAACKQDPGVERGGGGSAAAGEGEGRDRTGKVKEVKEAEQEEQGSNEGTKGRTRGSMKTR